MKTNNPTQHNIINIMRSYELFTLCKVTLFCCNCKVFFKKNQEK